MVADGFVNCIATNRNRVEIVLWLDVRSYRQSIEFVIWRNLSGHNYIRHCGGRLHGNILLCRSSAHVAD